MSFMRAFSEPVSGWNVETNCETEFVHGDTVPSGVPLWLDENGRPCAPEDGSFDEEYALEVFGDYIEGNRVDSAEWSEGWQSGIHAPGYTDREECGVFDTREEAAAACLSMFYDQPFSEMDTDELEDVRWLAEMAGDLATLAELDEFENEARPEDGDIVFSPCGALGGKTAVSVIGGKRLGEFVEWEDAAQCARQYMEDSQFWPNLWTQSDHGNMELTTL